MTQPTVQLKDLNFTYPGTTTGIFDINLELAQGELLAVIGASGSGKTTLLKAVAGFVTPQTGKVMINGQDLTTARPRLRNLGVVFQSYALFPNLSVWQNIAYPLKVRGVTAAQRKEKAIQMVERVGLKGFTERRIHTLSGGQQQRVALGRALVFEPQALLLDEPLSALDAGLRVEMRDEIRSIQKQQGIAALHITHDQEEALSMADRVAIMEKGRLVQIAPPKEVYDHPATKSIAAFVGQANLIDGVIKNENLVETPIGTLKTVAQKRPPQSKVCVLIRPENVIPLPEIPTEKGRENIFACSVTNDRFLGSIRRFDAEVKGQVITGETARRTGMKAIKIPEEGVQLLDN
ncbi:ABC transporter ATP-binding protein [Dethiosulfatarculus sandiegensis]|uniref:ABC transporter ATP-binding protein n=1 Tax=Dethiosulfatarculus sandiegensis TaxID=1429043 RepID=A0A0D2GDN3_9BACT|nr:ABC transporter ATP-binding protein [Dethiosulfatarculus sandiegensis]KIX13032.1 ABC transporter ATP-binding protein [Dethiosulfatarculus sandiegensis]